MKIAAVSDDGMTISQHFGRAAFYVVATVEGGVVTSRERRPKPGHAQFAQPGAVHGHVHGADHGQGGRHGFDSASQGRHAAMAAPISDCEILLARGMGAGPYESLQQAGIRPIVTDIAGIDEAVSACVDGTIVSHTDRLH